MHDFADIVIHNARGLTFEPGAPRAGSVAIRGNRIDALGFDDGNADALTSRIGPRTRVVDAQGGTLLPGLHDAHVHVFMGGISLTQLPLVGVRGEAALAQAIADYRAAHPGLAFLSAYGSEYDILGGGRSLDRHALDRLCPDIPVLVTSMDFHTGWVNSAALRDAGIERGANLSPGHRVVLDDTGEATGVLLELEAIDLVRRLMPACERHSHAAQSPLDHIDVGADGRAADRALLWHSLEYCAAHGLTSVQNMDGSLYQLELLGELLAKHGRLPVRVRMPFQFHHTMKEADLDHAVRWREIYDSDFLRCDFIKIFADGVVESGTAHMIAPYGTDGSWNSAPLFSDDELNAVVARADALGFQITIHSIGDGATRQVLNAYEHALRTNGYREARHRIEHIEVLHPDDLPRFSDLGVVASMQPSHVPPAGEGYLSLIGAERGRTAFPAADLRDAGVPVVFSSDWPVVPLSPFATIQAAVTRPKWPGARDQVVPLHSALSAHIGAAAWVGFREMSAGRIVPGFLADLTLLNRDIEAVSTTEIARVGVRLTICDGLVTFEGEDERT